MENKYVIGVEVTNKYTLLEENEMDPFEALFLKEQEKELEKKTKKEKKMKTEATAKSKPDVVQKRTKKENTMHKVQENKRENLKPNYQRLNANDKPERERNNFNKVDYENREKRSNQRHGQDKGFNSSGNCEGQDRPRRENNGGNFENRNRNERGGNRFVGNSSIAPRGPKRPYEQRDHRGNSESDTQSRSKKTEADKTNGNDKLRKDNNGGNFENRNRDRGERGDNRFLGNNSTGLRGPRRPYEERDRWGKREFDTQTGSGKTVADKSNGTDQSRGKIEKSEPNVVPQQKRAAKVIAEEEPKVLTLDEWKAQLAGRAKPQYNIRKAGEGEVEPSHWKEMYELRKQKNEPEVVEAAECPQRVRRQKQVLDIGTLFDCTRRDAGLRGRGPRDDRPNQRGGPGGPRGNPRDNGAGDGRPERRYHDEQDGADERNENHCVPKIDDKRDFPLLRRVQ